VVRHRLAYEWGLKSPGGYSWAETDSDLNMREECHDATNSDGIVAITAVYTLTTPSGFGQDMVNAIPGHR
jgi:hypothetical protein